MKPEDLQADFTPRLETVHVKAPPPRKGGAKVRQFPFLSSQQSRSPSSPLPTQVESVDAVVSKLKEAGVL